MVSTSRSVAVRFSANSASVAATTASTLGCMIDRMMSAATIAPTRRPMMRPIHSSMIMSPLAFVVRFQGKPRFADDLVDDVIGVAMTQ